MRDSSLKPFLASTSVVPPGPFSKEIAGALLDVDKFVVSSTRRSWDLTDSSSVVSSSVVSSVEVNELFSDGAYILYFSF